MVQNIISSQAIKHIDNNAKQLVLPNDAQLGMSNKNM